MYNITEEQIKDIALGGGKTKIKEMFPGVFEQKIEVGKWYKSENGHLYFIESIHPERYINPYQGYGFSASGLYQDSRSLAMKQNYRPATSDEVKTALITHAVMTGFDRPGIHFLTPLEKYKGITKETFHLTQGSLFSGSMAVFNKGKWAQIYTPISVEDAETKLNANGGNFKIE